MDLNASPPLPEEEDQHLVEQQQIAQEKEEEQDGHVETAVEILRRERNERRLQMKRKYPDDQRPNRTEPAVQISSSRHYNFYDRSKQLPPPGWLDCPPYGQCIGCIIPSKVPLGESYNDYVVFDKRYTLGQVIRRQRVLGRELGLVIDLTNTTRYYPPSDLKKQGIKYVKIACKGKDSVPDNESVNLFVHEVLEFCGQKQSGKYILVHCTHGHNRTGYMIVHFLMRSQQSLTVAEAIKAFSDSRPPGIYKRDYIDALYTSYHERKLGDVTCPPTPEWKRSCDLHLNNGEASAVRDEDDDGVIAPSHDQDNINPVQNEVMTNDDVLGDTIPNDQQVKMRQFCYQALKLDKPGSHPKLYKGLEGMSRFPGSHPVSLNMDNLQLLRQQYYYATWKADGTRYMMLITYDGCYLVDRTFTFRRVHLRFPSKQINEGRQAHHYTLLDGEMVIDTLADTNKQERRYLIYDLIAINGLSVINRPFYERWKMIEKELIEPRNLERQCMYKSRNPQYRYDLEPFRVRRKDFWLLSTITKLLKEFIPRLSHDADGLIFQGWDDPYVPFTHEGLLKWKYPEMNSVDFLFELVDGNRELMFLYERGKKKLMEGNQVIFKDTEDPSEYSGKIIECSWDSERNVWVCMRLRPDKNTPNDFSTYKKVMQSIRDNITEEVLLNEIGEVVSLPMYADRIRNDSKAHRRR